MGLLIERASFIVLSSFPVPLALLVRLLLCLLGLHSGGGLRPEGPLHIFAGEHPLCIGAAHDAW